MTAAAPLSPGDVIRVAVPDRNGHAKPGRPVVILKGPKEAGVYAGVAVSTVAPEGRPLAGGGPPPAGHVALPWRRGGHPKTVLNKPCAVVAGWILAVTAEQTGGRAGYLPADRFVADKAAVRAAPAAR